MPGPWHGESALKALLKTSCLPAPVKVRPVGQVVQLRFRPGREILGIVRLPADTEARMLMFEVRESDQFLKGGRVDADGRIRIMVPREPAGSLTLHAGMRTRKGVLLEAEAAVGPSDREVELVLTPKE